MPVRELFRDAVLVAAAAAVGWWCHVTEVHAQRGGHIDAADDLAFQFAPASDQASLGIYFAATHRLYVYPRVGMGNSHVNCEYSFRINGPGLPIDRENCPVGSQLP